MFSEIFNEVELEIKKLQLVGSMFRITKKRNKQTTITTIEKKNHPRKGIKLNNVKKGK